MIGGWKLVQQLVDREDDPSPIAATPAPSFAPSSAAPSSPAPPSPASAPNPADESASTSSSAADGSTSKAELYKIATELKIKGRSKMSKEELLKAINRAGEGA